MLDDASIVATYTENDAIAAIAVINPHDAEIGYTLPEGTWGVLINGGSIFDAPETTVSGNVTVPAQGILLVVNN